MLLLDTPKPQPLALVDRVIPIMPKGKVTEPKAVKNTQDQVRILGELMALKYARHEGDHQKSTLFFLVGLVISLSLSLVAFEWKSYDRGDLLDLGAIAGDFDEILEIPLTEQAPPPPPPQQLTTPTLVVVADEVVLQELDIKIDAEINQKDIIQDVVFEEELFEPEEEKVEEIFNIVESPATPVGGMAAFYEYVSGNMKYPGEAMRLGISGKVFVQFVVEKDGTLTDVKILKGIHEMCDAEAVRVVKNAPKWEPAKQRGRPVRMYQRLPIVFVLHEK